MDCSHSSRKSNKIIITGCSTEVGKTLASAIVVTALQADYWKPVQSGEEGDLDTTTIKKLVSETILIHPPKYSFNHPVSPHQAARLENITIDPQLIQPPQTNRPLIIETAGGLLVPLTLTTLALDRFSQWDANWIIVSRHYLGSINHTLLTVEELRRRNCRMGGLIFNGSPYPDCEAAILQFSQLPMLGRLMPEPVINPKLIQEYACQWKPALQKILA